MALLLTNSLAHLMVDAVCAAALFSCGGRPDGGAAAL
jgi:hypothetical protein